MNIFTEENIQSDLQRFIHADDCRNTDPLLPAVVEGLGLVHPVPVATKAAAVPVVTVVAVLVAEVATVTASLMELVVGGKRAGIMSTLISRFSKRCGLVPDRTQKPTWPGCPRFPPRFMLPPPPLPMFPL